MRLRSLLISSLTLMGLVVLAATAPKPAMMQDLPAGPRPTATAEALPPDYQPAEPAAPEAMPDLIVESIRLTPRNPYANQKVWIEVTIKNVGNQDVAPGNNFYLDFYVNPPTNDLRGLRGDVYWPVQGYSMKAGATATFTTEWTFHDTAAFNLWAQVDTPEWGLPPDPPLPTGNVSESDEDNNILGPQYTMVRTHYQWVQKDHTDFFSNMASTLDVVPVLGTVGIITNTPGLVINGDSALALGIFDEPPKTTWGLPSLNATGLLDYNMMDPDVRLNYLEPKDQQNVFVHAEYVPAIGEDLVVAVWEDGRNGPTYGKDVYLRWSDDSGATWCPGPDPACPSDPDPEPDLQVNDTLGTADNNDQKDPAVAVAPDGRVVVAWQDHRGSSFDIYVQVFKYEAGALRRCPSNGDCAVTCDPATNLCNKKVDTDAFERDQIMPDAAVDALGNFYIAWQDQRNLNDDVFAVRSYYSATPCPDVGKGVGFVPESRVSDGTSPDATYLCWGDDTRIHDDPSSTKQSAPSISALNGIKVKEIIWDYIPGTPPTLIVLDVITEPTTYVVVTWEDRREGDTDIYITYSDDEGETFVQDWRVNDDKAPNSTNGIEQTDPAVASNQWMKEVTLVAPTPFGNATGIVKLPVTTMHIVWEDTRHSMSGQQDTDIYYVTVDVQPETMWPWPIKFTQNDQVKVNNNDRRAWQAGPVWQGDPDVMAKSSELLLADSDAYNAFVIWADGRNYGGEFSNLDIYFRLFSSMGEPAEFIGGNNLMVNDNVRLHSFTQAAYPLYRADNPPHAHQRSPSISATLIAEWPTIFGGYVYAAWDDDRLGDPFYDRNVYFARSNMLFGGHGRPFVKPPAAPMDTPGQGEAYGSGSFVSSIMDSGTTETEWYTIDWHAVTDKGTYITLQTRMGNTLAEVLGSDWYPKRFPYPDDAISKGSPLQGYDAPGQHIENALGAACPAACPKARYIQYRVNFWARNTAASGVELHTPFLFDVILHYERPPGAYLPVVFKAR